MTATLTSLDVRAACTVPGVDPDLFTSRGAEDVAAARAICATCPVKAACLQAALESGASGVWGGTTKAERASMEVRKSPEHNPRVVHARGGRPINHGTVGGYATHRKRREDACDECRAAVNAYQKQLRAKARRPNPQEETT